MTRRFASLWDVESCCPLCAGPLEAIDEEEGPRCRPCGWARDEGVVHDAVVPAGCAPSDLE